MKLPRKTQKKRQEIMKSNYQILIKREWRINAVDLRCTEYQARRVCDALAYASVEQDVFAVELWLNGKNFSSKVATWRMR